MCFTHCDQPWEGETCAAARRATAEPFIWGPMASIFALAVLLFIAYLIVLAGALGYELTGIDRQTARFQALSAFTGTGFTTRVSELVVRHPVRRRITTTLIILGYGTTASVVAALLESFHEVELLALAQNVAIIAVLGAIVSKLISLYGQSITDRLRRVLTQRYSADRVPHEELLLYKKGFGITRIEVPEGSRMEGKSLRTSDLRARHVQVLAVEEYNDVHPIPDPDWMFRAGQHLIVYGDLRGVQVAFAPEVTVAQDRPNTPDDTEKSAADS